MTRVELKRRPSARPAPQGVAPASNAYAIDRVFVVHVCDEVLALPIDRVQTVFMAREIAPAPLTPPWVRGLVNLRGTVVTAISLRARLGLPERGPQTEDCGGELGIAVDVDGEAFALLVDKVGDVAQMTQGTALVAPSAMSEKARRLTARVYARDSGLLPIIDLRAAVFDQASKTDLITQD